MSNDGVITFWKNYYEASFVERIKLLKPLVKNIFSIYHNNLNESTKNRILNTTLLFYFNDLIEFMEYKNENIRDNTKK